MRTSTLSLLALGLLAAAPLQAQVASEGFFLEGTLSGNSLTVSVEDEDGDAQTGGGFGLRLGYGFTPRFALYGNLAGASIKSDDPDVFGDAERTTMANLELGGQLSFPSPARAFVPYLNLGLQGTAVTADDSDGDVVVSGGGLVLGGGVRYHVQPAVALNLGLEGMAGAFTTITVDGDDLEFDDLGIDDPTYRGARLRFGVTWFPGR